MTKVTILAIFLTVSSFVMATINPFTVIEFEGLVNSIETLETENKEHYGVTVTNDSGVEIYCSLDKDQYSAFTGSERVSVTIHENNIRGGYICTDIKVIDGVNRIIEE